MPHPRFEKLPPERREAILDAALEEFATHGFDDASYNKIIEKAGVSKGAMYYYFDDKADLFATVIGRVERQFDPVLQDLRPVDSPEQFWQQVRDAVKRTIDLSTRDPLTVAVIRNAWRLRREGRHDALRSLLETARGWTASLIEQGQRCGAVRTDLPFDLLVALVTAIDEAGDSWALENTDATTESLHDWAECFLELLWRVLTPGVAPNPLPGAPRAPET